MLRQTLLDAAQRWADEWAAAWRAHDVDRVRALYADEADFRSAPFRDSKEPGAYAQWAFADEEPGGDVRFGEPFVIEPDRAAVEYWAVVKDPRGRETTIAGVAILRFNDTGLVVDQRDYWNQAEGRHAPHPHWGA